MEKNLEKYLISNVRSLDEWKDIANKSLKDISIEDLYKDYDKDIQKKILYTENDYSKFTNFSYSRGIKKDHDENLPWHICSIIDPTNDAQLYNSRILNELERGASSIEDVIAKTSSGGALIGSSREPPSILRPKRFKSIE